MRYALAVHDLHSTARTAVPAEVHVSNLAHFSRVGSATLVGTMCLGFTVAEAEPARVDYVEDPMAPHNTTGSTARLGTSVGFLYGEHADALALGLVGAAGRRWGRLALEGEYGAFQLSQVGPSDRVLGRAQRLGVIARFEVVRLGSTVVGGNSMLALYVEGGADVAWNNWYAPPADATVRMIPSDTKRVEGQAGFGIMLDHRLQEPIGFPHRIGWFLGWRLAMAPHAAEASTVCRGAICRAAVAMPDSSGDRFIDRSMLFQSSLAATW